MNYKGSFSKAVMKHFHKISLKDFGNQRNLEICMQVFSCTFKSFVYIVHTPTRACTLNVSSPDELFFNIDILNTSAENSMFFYQAS